MYHEDSSLPPPLISYKRYRLDLNTISCSASQPHYIALGGAHLHCFLHDRRMAGRDLLAERGIPGNVSPANSISPNDNELMGQATRCVRKFAPNGQKRMLRTDNGHITACKISDANPNEMIVSWSGDHIYSFDLIRSSDAADVAPKEILSRSGTSRKMESTDRKRKRIKQHSSTSVDDARPNSKPRQISNSGNENGDLSIRIRYENGQSEDIAMGDHLPTISPQPAEEARDLLLSESQKRGLQIAKSIVSIRKLMFSLDAHTRTLPETTQYDHTSHSTIFTSVLGLASACLSMVDEMISNWKYPLDPLPEDVVLQRTLRSNRDSSRRFIQATGTLARLLGGKLQTCDRIQDHLLQMFQQIAPSPYEDPLFSQTQIFSYEFLKAIGLWLDGGAEALLQGFKRPKNQRLDSPRFPVPNEAEISGVDDYVIPYLLSLAQENYILNVDSSRFEKDESRKVFETETAAVIAFSHAIRIPLKDLSTAVVAAPDDSPESSLPKVQDKKTAINFWAFKVGRGLLMAAGKGFNYQFVEIAFGGLGTDSIDEGRLQDDIDVDETDDVVESISLMKEPAYKSTGDSTAIDSLSQGNEKESEGLNGSNNSDGMSRDGTADVENLGSDAEVVLMEDLHNELADQMGDDYDEDDEDDDDDGYRDDQDEEGDDDDDEITAEERQLLFQSASDRGKLRESVEKNVPCSSHSRQYKGHCNVKTVKDANFFGLEDEYVVSGSDSGHLFIWDKKTSQLVNILEGDNEVVNVVQGMSRIPLHKISLSLNVSA